MSKLHITKGSGKMENIYSINTPSSSNPFCQKMSQTDSVCKSCYAMRNEKYRKSIVPAFERNVAPLLSRDFEAPMVPFTVMRLHSYGELHNGTHFANFVKLALANPNTFFSLWTKRFGIIQGFLRKGGIVPSNLNLIYSNPRVGKEVKVVPKGFHKVFNVHSTKDIEKNGVEINCGAKDCSTCMLCYTKNEVSIINEKKK